MAKRTYRWFCYCEADTPANYRWLCGFLRGASLDPPEGKAKPGFRGEPFMFATDPRKDSRIGHALAASNGKLLEVWRESL